MKKEKEENISKKFKKKPMKIQLIKKLDKKDNSKIFNNTFSNNFTSINKETNRLLNQKLNNKQPHKFNLTNQSNLVKKTLPTENTTSNNKSIISLGINTYKNNQNKKNNNINNKMTSSFYITQEDKNKQSKINIKNIKKLMLNLTLNENIKERNKNKRDLIGNSLTYRNNVNINNELNKKSIVTKKVNNEQEKKINKNENKNKINKNKINDDSRKNKFNRTKTAANLKNPKDKEKMMSKGKSLIKYENNDNDKKTYNNLYDKYLDKFKERMHKISLVKNYRNDDEMKIIKEKEIKNQNVQNKEMLKRYKTQTNFFKRNLDKKDKENNIQKQNQEVPKKQSTKIKIEKRKVGKSVGIKRDKDNNKNKENNVEVKKNKKENKNESNDNKIKIPKRSKSMAKLTEHTKKNLNDDKYNIDYILYEKIKPSRNEDAFDDIDSIVKQLDFNRIRLKSKNIFNVEDNEKYEIYSKNFDNLYDKAINDNSLRRSIEKNKNNENNSNTLQNEKTTDSFKKNKINVSFIENQNQNN
jgi:hypothetical protein